MLDEGPKGWEAGSRDVTRVSTGMIDPREVVELPGESNEQTLFLLQEHGRMNNEEWKELVDSIKNKGLEYRPLIMVSKEGKPSIYEGNHRIRAAIEAGVEKIPIEIRYLGNSQRTHGLIPIDKSGK